MSVSSIELKSSPMVSPSTISSVVPPVTDTPVPEQLTLVVVVLAACRLAAISIAPSTSCVAAFSPITICPLNCPFWIWAPLLSVLLG